MNFAQMLFSSIKPMVSEAARIAPARKNNAATRSRFEKRYKEAFRVFNWIATGPQIAGMIGVIDGGKALAKLEARGLTKRIGKRPNGGTNATIVHEWIGNKE